MPQDDVQIESNEAAEALNMENKPQIVGELLPVHLPIIPVFRRPIFPGIVLPLQFDKPGEIEKVMNSMEKGNGYVGLVLANDDTMEDEPSLYEIGTAFHLFRINNAQKGGIQVLGQAIRRFRKKKVQPQSKDLVWEVEYIYDEQKKPDRELKAYMLAISNQVKELLALNPLFKEQVNQLVSQLNYETPGLTMDLISNLIMAEKHVLQELLETIPFKKRAMMLLKLLKEELQVAEIQVKINEQINAKVQKQQREFFLREQLAAIKKELGLEKEDKESEIEQLEEKLRGKTLSEEALQIVEKEINKLKLLNPESPDYNVTRNYLQLISELPWGIFSEDNVDIKKARKILDRDHYGLQDVKDRILEFLSSIIKKGKIGGSIICLVGPPGVGKTSIGKSIAHSMGRKFYRFSVGGMRDEAEIKGHRRTYIGALPGKLIQSINRVNTSNPVIMLDEIDKIGTSFRGDPASALLEVLDPEQNAEFLDHYLDIPFDLSNVLFITTANQLDTIPGPLLDRMELIRLSGYITQEKVEIAQKYLVPKQLDMHGFGKNEISFTKAALRYIIEHYAREAGVRNLEKHIRKVIRKISLIQAEEGQANMKVTEEEIIGYLGKPIFTGDKLYQQKIPGVVMGLAYTSFGGATLYVESSAIKGGGGFKQTGQLGNVMRESSEIAYSFIRSLLSNQDPDNSFFKEHFVHLHVPEGATPKDGPSAGITMALSLYSLAKNKPVRKGIAMTGELSLTGRVLRIGGVKEKTLGAKRAGIKELIFPLDNKNDFEELPAHIRKGLKPHFVDHFVEVLGIAMPKR